MSAASERADYIASAQRIQALDVPGDEPGRFERVSDGELGAAFEVLIGHSGEDDYETLGDGTVLFRFGRWLFWRTEQGFWQLEEHGSVERADECLKAAASLDDVLPEEDRT